MKTVFVSALCTAAALVCLNVGQVAAAEGGGCRIPNTWLRLVNPNPSLPVFPPFTKPSIEECYYLCALDPRCHSINYWKNDGSCTMLPFSHFAPSMYSTRGFTELVITNEADHFSPYACSQQEFWEIQQQPIADTNPYFRRHGDKCFFAYVAEIDSFYPQKAQCARLGAIPAKIRSQAQADDFRQWIGELEERRLTWGYTVFVGARAPNCRRGWFWEVDNTPVTWYQPYNETRHCYDAMVFNSHGFYQQWHTNPRGMICERPCLL